ncbi:hypothetical protein MMC25_006609 [Agyrium rufum]|nr:hypothetical protein [Agyrium rufum]
MTLFPTVLPYPEPACQQIEGGTTNATSSQNTQVSLILLIAAAYTTSRTINFSLPIPVLAISLSILLPILTYPSLRLTQALSVSVRSNARKPHPLVILLTQLTPYILVVLQITLINLSLIFSSSSSSAIIEECVLRSRWLALFRAKDVSSVRRIQDAMECCGFKSSRDMAWPFKDREHDDRACEVAFGRHVGCEERWRGEARKIAGFMVLVGVVGVICVVFTVLDMRQIWPGFSSSSSRRGDTAAIGAGTSDSNRPLHSRLLGAASDHDEQDDGEERDEGRVSEEVESYADHPERRE